MVLGRALAADLGAGLGTILFTLGTRLGSILVTSGAMVGTILFALKLDRVSLPIRTFSFKTCLFLTFSLAF